MKNGVNKHMNAPSNIGPVFGKRILIGPDIEAPGWGQRYASPYQLPLTKPTEWNGPDRPDFTRGRHIFRTIPRGEGYISPTDNPMAPPYAHGLGMVIRGLGGCSGCGMGQEESKSTFSKVALLGVLGLGLYLMIKG